MARVKPLKENDTLYLRLPNTPMGLQINDIYGYFVGKTESADSATDSKTEKYIVLNIKDETVIFSKEIFTKWFSNEIIEATKPRKKVEPKTTTSATKTPTTRRKR